jgi:hypothetical protein
MLRLLHQPPPPLPLHPWLLLLLWQKQLGAHPAALLHPTNLPAAVAASGAMLRPAAARCLLPRQPLPPPQQ